MALWDTVNGAACRAHPKGNMVASLGPLIPAGCMSLFGQDGENPIDPAAQQPASRNLPILGGHHQHQEYSPDHDGDGSKERQGYTNDWQCKIHKITCDVLEGELTACLMLSHAFRAP